MSKVVNKYRNIRFLIDVITISGAFISAYWMNSSKVTFVEFLIILAIFIFTWFTAAYFSSIYGDRRSKKFSEEFVYIFYTILLYAILLSSVSFFINFLYLNTGQLFYTYFIILFPAIIVVKYIFRKYIHSIIYKGSLFETVLIIGSTPSAFDYIETINKFYYYGYRCIGIIDNVASETKGLNYLGKISDLKMVLNDNEIDEVVIALPYAQSQEIQYIMEVCDFANINIKILPDFTQYASASIQVNNVGLVPVMNVMALSLDKTENKLLKRLVDVFGAMLFLFLIGFWLLPIIALLVKIGSKGPIFFKQERWGLNNQRIICYKFRSMNIESESFNDNGAYNQVIKDDKRVTTIGRFLRKNNFDELPQFWNVLIGNMSIVGPRPHPIQLNLESMHSVDNYMLRHMVLPGITGWAQVNGFRGATTEPGSMQKRINYDLYYIHNWTIWLDFQIILQTVINFFRGDQNAY
jgi:putative colanic acid biosynthesis UDP-glucose lipid carrier transferase